MIMPLSPMIVVDWSRVEAVEHAGETGTATWRTQTMGDLNRESAETLGCTTGLAAPGPVNLEKALRFGDRLGGHLVAGHVDGVGTVHAMRTVAGGDGSVTLEVEVPTALARFVAPKGSIAVQGVSLTVNAVSGTRFTVNLIPHTLAVTTLGDLAPGARVNLEADLIARYVARLHDTRA